MFNVTQEMFASVLQSACQRETSADPSGWTPENSLWGHCAVVALVAQDFFGGEILRASLAAVPEFAQMRSHYWNRLPDGSERDFTAPQFDGRYPPGLLPETRMRFSLLSHDGTRRRYELLVQRVAEAAVTHRMAAVTCPTDYRPVDGSNQPIPRRGYCCPGCGNPKRPEDDWCLRCLEAPPSLTG